MKGKERTLVEFSALFLRADPDRMYLAYINYDIRQLSECGVNFRVIHGREELRNHLFELGMEYIRISKNSRQRLSNKFLVIIKNKMRRLWKRN